jgi:hypothetical protein
MMQLTVRKDDTTLLHLLNPVPEESGRNSGIATLAAIRLLQTSDALHFSYPETIL